mmetsp:Transcript_33221/g.80571  ORF Transcript_33221/g.80571 Transcript_33221/m.80571 type:complete len:233 (+) Transcript_33221:115-813(+)
MHGKVSPMSCKKNKELALVCLHNHYPMQITMRNVSLLESMGFQEDRDIIEAAISKCWLSIKYASLELQLDPNLILLAFDNMPKASRFFGAEYARVFSSLFVILHAINQALVAQNDRLIDVLVRSSLSPDEVLKEIVEARSLESTDNEPEAKRLVPTIDVNEWRRFQWERVWLIGKVHYSFIDSKTVTNDIQRNIIEYSGLNQTISLYRELKKWEPVLNRLNDLGLGIPSSNT